MHVRIGAVAFLILMAGSIVLGIEVIIGDIKGNAISAVLIFMSVAAMTLLLNPNTRKGLVSGYGPFDSEALAFDTKFEDVHVNGRISGNIAIS